MLRNLSRYMVCADSVPKPLVLAIERAHSAAISWVELRTVAKLLRLRFCQLFDRLQDEIASTRGFLIPLLAVGDLGVISHGHLES